MTMRSQYCGFSQLFATVSDDVCSRRVSGRRFGCLHRVQSILREAPERGYTLRELCARCGHQWPAKDVSAALSKLVARECVERGTKPRDTTLGRRLVRVYNWMA